MIWRSLAVGVALTVIAHGVPVATNLARFASVDGYIALRLTCVQSWSSGG